MPDIANVEPTRFGRDDQYDLAIEKNPGHAFVVSELSMDQLAEIRDTLSKFLRPDEHKMSLLSLKIADLVTWSQQQGFTYQDIRNMLESELAIRPDYRNG